MAVFVANALEKVGQAADSGRVLCYGMHLFVPSFRYQP
jgi:hypothetical protein